MKALPLNTVIISGNLTDDPKLYHVGEKKLPKLSFVIANNLYFNKKEHTSYIEITIWNDNATKLSTQLKKGSAVVVDGRLQTSSFTDSKGVRRKNVQISANRIFNLSWSDAGGSDAPASTDNDSDDSDPDYTDDIPF